MYSSSTFLLLLLCLVFPLSISAQTPTSQRLTSFEQSKQHQSPFQKVSFRSIGPTVMSGRVTDIEVNPNNTSEFYVAYASGGVWHTTNNGQSFTPIFDKEATHTIGDMAMDWNTGCLWVGTGEVNSSRSSYAGTGVYKTIDTGKTWQHLGLEESHHIGRIVLHPSNPSIAWVAVLGHLYTKNMERGVYKTIDGGKSWQQTLFINDSTGCVDLCIDPQSSEILYASVWARTRVAWNFNGSGEASAVFKSTNGGETWINTTKEESGFPTGNGVGRIGISICKKNPSVLYALLDNQFNQKEEKNKEKKIKAKELQSMSSSDFLQLDSITLAKYLEENDYPSKYTVDSVRTAVKNKVFSVKDIADWKLADADNNLFDTPVIGAELYRSNDAGNSWTKTHTDLLEGVYFTYGYYFGTISVSPINPDKVCIAGYPILLSEDGGKTFRQMDGDNCHPDYHRVWINPLNDKHIIAGNDGGINITYDDGKHWIKANNPPVGQFYAVQVDDAKPYNVYGGLQDNGTWMAASTTVENTAWHQTGQNAYTNIGDGDGMQVMVDTRNNETTYVGYQFGNYYRLPKVTSSPVYITPKHDIGQKPFRFNWQTPILLSKHHQDIFYIGSNVLHRSLHQGDEMKEISKDLTANNRKGNIPYATLTTIAESILEFGLLYTGSDDGIISCSKDGGYSWTRISNSLPANLWVSRVVASKFSKARVYASLNNYRNDDFTPYLFVSDEYGKNWKQLGKDLPNEPINVVREDVKDENILYVGTDNGLYVSFDAGIHFIPWDAELPRVAVHDMVIQERENELVLGTHGRSIYIAKLDRIQLYPTIKDKELYLLALRDIKFNKETGNKSSVYATPDSAKVDIHYFSKNGGKHQVKILDKKGNDLYSFSQDAIRGFNVVEYHLQCKEQGLKYFSEKPKKAEDGNYYLPIGEYKVHMINPNGIKVEEVLKVVK